MSDYAFVHEGKAYTPNGTDVPAGHAAEHNAAIERAELEVWQARPDRFVAYYDVYFGTARAGTSDAGTVKTWLGTVIGRVVAATIYRHNFGGRFVSLRVMGSNGAEYHGRASWDGGDAITLRRVK